VLWLTLPELAVTVTVYVPAGVPDDELLPPPQPTNETSPKTITDAASVGSRPRIRTNMNPAAKKATVHVNGIVPNGVP
jgi:hypothetical protein